MKKQLWSGMMKELEKASGGKSYKLDAAAQSIALEKLRKVVETRTAALDEPTGQKLAQICANVLRRVRYPREASMGLDGATYHAGHWVRGAFLAGKTWSPREGTLAASFVEMELALKRFAEAPEAQRAAAKEALLREAERVNRQLEARAVGTEPTNKAAQRTDASGDRR